MDKEVLIELIDRKLNSYKIANETNRSETNIRYWLKKYDLKTKPSSIKCCPKCGDDKKLTEFYNRRKKEGGSVYCKICTKEEGRERARKFKLKCVDYKGGECEKCGYDKYIGALEFHHLDPKEKDFGIANVKSHAFNDDIKKELDKCILVCSNCHREIHGFVA